MTKLTGTERDTVKDALDTAFHAIMRSGPSIRHIPEIVEMHKIALDKLADALQTAEPTDELDTLKTIIDQTKHYLEAEGSTEDLADWIFGFVRERRNQIKINADVEKVRALAQPASDLVEQKPEEFRPMLMNWALGYAQTDNGVVMDALEYLVSRGYKIVGPKPPVPPTWEEIREATR